MFSTVPALSTPKTKSVGVSVSAGYRKIMLISSATRYHTKGPVAFASRRCYSNVSLQSLVNSTFMQHSHEGSEMTSSTIR
jgi:hypothetical protein